MGPVYQAIWIALHDCSVLSTLSHSTNPRGSHRFISSDFRFLSSPLITVLNGSGHSAAAKEQLQESLTP